MEGVTIRKQAAAWRRACAEKLPEKRKEFKRLKKFPRGKLSSESLRRLRELEEIFQ